MVTGNRMWSRDIGSIQTPWVAGDFIYVLDNDERLICLSRKEGKVKWVHQLPEFGNPDKQRYPILWAGPVLVSNKLILVSSDGYAEALSPLFRPTAGAHVREYSGAPTSRLSWLMA